MNLMPYEKALKILKTHIKKYNRIEKISLTECLNRILAKDIISKNNHPPYPTASMDGYDIKLKNKIMH